MERSACGVRLSVSVAELLAVLVSVMPEGTATLAVLAREPVAVETRVAVRLKVAVPPERILTVLLMLPEPEAVVQEEPLEAVQVQVAPDKAAGKVSLTVAPTTSPGPLLVTVMT